MTITVVEPLHVQSIINKSEAEKLRRDRQAERLKTLLGIIKQYDIGIRVAALIMDLREIAAADHISLERAAEMLRPTLECELDFALETLTEREAQ